MSDRECPLNDRSAPCGETGAVWGHSSSGDRDTRRRTTPSHFKFVFSFTPVPATASFMRLHIIYASTQKKERDTYIIDASHRFRLFCCATSLIRILPARGSLLRLELRLPSLISLLFLLLVFGKASSNLFCWTRVSGRRSRGKMKG
jgi:hypothetical protein